MTILQILIIYLLIINLVAFAAYGIDKYKAKKNKWRITEKTLILIAAFGGSIGALLGIKIFHHKTLHKKFKYGIPAILFIQIIAAAYITYYFFYL